MAKTKEIKTNAMRILDSLKISYESYFYECDEFIDALKIADQLGLPYEKVYKTLVTRAASKNYYVFVIPVAEKLDMKKAASSVGEKNVEMLPMKDLLKVTGYVHGGCSPIGMKKKFVTYFDTSINNYEEIFVSAGRVGVQIKIKVTDLIKITDDKLVI